MAYSYKYPQNCADFIGIFNPYSLDRKIEYVFENSDQGTLILTNQPEAVGEITALITDTGVYPPDFVLAF